MNRASLHEVHQLWLEASRPDRLYPLVSHGWCYDFYTGKLPGDSQTIAFWDGPEDVVLLLFDCNGPYLGWDRQRIRPFPETRAESMTDDGIVHSHFGRELGFVPARINVRRFLEPQWSVSVEPLADCYRKFVCDPVGCTKGDPQEMLDLTEVVRKWVKEGLFAFLFYNEFWMGSDGEVECS